MLPLILAVVIRRFMKGILKYQLFSAERHDTVSGLGVLKRRFIRFSGSVLSNEYTL